MRRTALYLCAAVLGTTAAPPALAQSASDVVNVIGRRPSSDVVVRVSYADLQLTSAADAGTLRMRVKDAAYGACGDMYRRATPSQEWRCRDLAMGVARPQIDRAIAVSRSGYAAASTTILIAFAAR